MGGNAGEGTLRIKFRCEGGWWVKADLTGCGKLGAAHMCSSYGPFPLPLSALGPDSSWKHSHPLRRNQGAAVPAYPRV